MLRVSIWLYFSPLVWKSNSLWHVMKQVWEVFTDLIPKGKEMFTGKCQCQTAVVKKFLKIDPLAIYLEEMSWNWSSCPCHSWKENGKMAWPACRNAGGSSSRPVNIYEVHGSWKRNEDGSPYSFSVKRRLDLIQWRWTTHMWNLFVLMAFHSTGT